jgi:hypothetical protein
MNAPNAIFQAAIGSDEQRERLRVQSREQLGCVEITLLTRNDDGTKHRGRFAPRDAQEFADDLESHADQAAMHEELGTLISEIRDAASVVERHQ